MNEKKILGLAKKFDNIVIPNFSYPPNPNFFYFSGHSNPGVLVYNGKFNFYTTQFDYRYKGKIIKNYYNFVSSLKNVGIDMSGWPFGRVGKNISNELNQLRVLKTEKEIKEIKKRCSDALKVFKKIKRKIYGRSEREVGGMFIYEFSKMGYDPSFEPIVSTRGDVHHINSDRIISQDDTVLMDFGVWRGYASDNTRMINPDPKLSRVISKVFEYAESAKPGMKISDFCEGVRKVMGKYNRYFYHALGHGVGIGVHELPNISIYSKEKFEEGMVFTIEPGIYTKKKFIRIEDVFVMRKDGIEKLS